MKPESMAARPRLQAPRAHGSSNTTSRITACRSGPPAGPRVSCTSTVTLCAICHKGRRSNHLTGGRSFAGPTCKAGAMRALARWCFRNKFVVLAIWVVALLALGGLSAGAGSGYTDSFSLPGTESTTALNLLTDNFNTESTDTNQVVFGADDVTDPAVQKRIEQTLKAIATGPHVERVNSPFAAGAAARQIAKDKTVAFANVHRDGDQPIADVPKSAYDTLIATAEAGRGDGLQVELGGAG